MEARNSCGRRISLLNDAPPAPTRKSLASTRHSSYSSQSSGVSYTFSSNSVTRLSSFHQSGSSTPCSSPQTPSLIRSRSSDSTTMQTPSPITPEFGYVDSLPPQQAYADPTAYFSKELPQYNPQQVAALNQPYMQSVPAQSAYTYSQPPTETNTKPAQKSKKNQYPCPVAKTYNCNDYFTTSGHAARHAKKHTGKKDALCPDCNKAFTRKDNMEQHRRTHMNGRNTAKGIATEDRSRKAPKQALRRPKPAPLQAAQGVESMMVDPALPSLPISPTTSFTMTPGLQMDAFTQPYMQRHTYPDPSQCAIAPLNIPSFGLDALALAAASGEKRDFGE